MNASRLAQMDERWSARLRVAERPGWLRTLAAFLAHSGDSWFWAAGLLVTILWGSADGRVWAIRVLVAIAATAVVVMAIKLLVRRRRPAGDWGSIYRLTDPHSFPSGHAARAVLLAVLITGWGPPWLAPLVILWAPLVSLARVAMGVHYLSDVVAGAVLGLVAGAVALASVRLVL